MTQTPSKLLITIEEDRPTTRPINRMRAVHPGEVLREDFIVPLWLSAHALAKDLGVPARAFTKSSKSAAHPLPPFVHTFTHFTLEIAPWRIELPAAPRMFSEPAWQWLALGQTRTAALPTPVREILNALNS